MRIDREELAKRLHTESVYTIAEGMGITPLQLAVICKEQGLEWPGAGAAPDQAKTVSKKERRVRRDREELPIPIPTKNDLERGKLTFSRSKLYELVWTYPHRSTRSDLGDLRRCDRENLQTS